MIALNSPRQSVTINGHDIEFSPNEWAIVLRVFRGAGQVVHYGALYSAVWGMADRQPETAKGGIKALLFDIRRKLGCHRDLIVTRDGIGLWWDDQAAPRPQPKRNPGIDQPVPKGLSL